MRIRSSLSLTVTLMGCSAKEAISCGEGVVLQESECVPVGVTTPRDTGSSSAVDTGPQDTGEPASLSEILLHGTVVTAIDRETPVGSGCVEVWSHHQIFVLDEPELLASAIIQSDGRWSTSIAMPTEDMPPLIQVVDCEGEANFFQATATWIEPSVMAEWKRTGDSGPITTMSFSLQQISSVDQALLAIGMSTGFRDWGGIFGTTVDRQGNPVAGVETGCVDGICPSYYPADGPVDESWFSDEGGVTNQSTGALGRFAIPTGTINTYSAGSETMNFNSITAGTMGDESTVICLDFTESTD